MYLHVICQETEFGKSPLTFLTVAQLASSWRKVIVLLSSPSTISYAQEGWAVNLPSILQCQGECQGQTQVWPFLQITIDWNSHVLAMCMENNISTSNNCAIYRCSTFMLTLTVICFLSVSIQLKYLCSFFKRYVNKYMQQQDVYNLKTTQIPKGVKWKP